MDLLNMKNNGSPSELNNRQTDENVKKMMIQKSKTKLNVVNVTREKAKSQKEKRMINGISNRESKTKQNGTIKKHLVSL